MGKLYNKVNRFVHKLSDFLNKLSCVIVVVVGLIMTSCLVWGVFTRFILKNPAIFTEEVARFCMIWLAFTGSSIAMKRCELTSYRALVDRLPEKGRKIMEIIGTLLLLTYLVIFLISGNGAMKIFKRTKGSVTKLPLIYPAAGLYFGACVMIVHAVALLLNQIKVFADCCRKEGNK